MVGISASELDVVFNVVPKISNSLKLPAAVHEIVEAAERRLLCSTAMREMEKIVPEARQKPHLLIASQDYLAKVYKDHGLAPGDSAAGILVGRLTDAFKTVLRNTSEDLSKALPPGRPR